MISLTDLLDELRIPYFDGKGHKHCRVGWIQTNCPLCSDDNYKLGINKAYLYCNCYVCGHLNLEKYLHLATNLSYSVVKQSLVRVERSRLPEREIVKGTLKWPTHMGELLKGHKDYLLSRNYDLDIIETWDLKATNGFSDHPWRIIAPITLRGKPVSWQGRSIAPTARLRWQGPGVQDEAYSRMKVLYGEQYARSGVVVVEGPSDTWKVGKGCVSTISLNYSSEQVERLSRFKSVAVCFDNTPDAQRKARKLCNELNVFRIDVHNIQIDSKDPGEATEEELNFIRQYIF